MKFRTKLLGAIGLLAVIGVAGAHSQGLQYYTTLSGSEGIADQLNPTGASFTSGLVHATSQGVNAQTGTSYTVLGTTGIPQSGAAPTGDMGKLVTFSNTGAVAVSLPQAGTAGFEAGKWLDAENLNSVAVTITPTTSTINGASTLVLDQNRGVRIYSDGTNWQIMAGGGGLLGTPLTVPEGGTGAATFTAHGVLIGEGATPIVAASVGATGTILAGTSGADPAFTATPSGLTSIEATTLNAGLATGTAGTVAVFPGTTTTGKTTFTATANSGNTTTNINTAAQAGARTYTVPDQGGNATFQMTGGTVSSTTGMTVTPLPLVNMKTVAGLQMTGSASSTNWGLVYTPATGNYLTGTATSSGSTSNVASYDIVLPANYIAGTNITLKVACYYTNSSSTASVHTMAAAAYLNDPVLGTQGSTLIATSAQTCPITTATAQTFTITGTSLVPGSYLTLTFSAAVTNGGGASTEFLTAANIN